MEETEHSLTKMIVKTVVGTVAASVITKTVVTVVPSSQKFKIAEMVGSIGGWKVSSMLEERLDNLVDMFYERRKARKLKLF